MSIFLLSALARIVGQWFLYKNICKSNNKFKLKSITGLTLLFGTFYAVWTLHTCLVSMYVGTNLHEIFVDVCYITRSLSLKFQDLSFCCYWHKNKKVFGFLSTEYRIFDFCIRFQRTRIHEFNRIIRLIWISRFFSRKLTKQAGAELGQAQIS